MAFSTEPTQTPTTIGDFYVTLLDNADAPDTIRGIIQIRDQNENVMATWTGSLVPHLTAPQITALQSFMADLRAQAAAQLLP